MLKPFDHCLGVDFQPLKLTSISNSEGERFYQTPKGYLPSVTTILGATKPDSQKESLTIWRENLRVELEAQGASEDEIQKALMAGATRGTYIHSLVENYVEHDELPDLEQIPEEYQGYWTSIFPLVLSLEEYRMIECNTWHTLGYAGTLDALGLYEGQLTLCDWKTSSKFKKKDWILDYFLQLAAYTAALNERFQCNIKQAFLVLARPDRAADTYLVRHAELYDYWLQFKDRLAAYQFMRR